MKEKIIEILKSHSYVDMTGYYEKIITDDRLEEVADDLLTLMLK